MNRHAAGKSDRAAFWARLYIVLPVFVGLLLAWRLVPYQRDDAFIAYRFAANFAESGEIVFNQGGPWVEGFSSPAWFILLSLIAKTTGSSFLPTASMWLGLFFFLLLILTGAVTANMIRRSSPDSQNHLQTFFSAALLATLPAACYYAATGLETLLFGIVVLFFGAATAGLLPIALGLAAGLSAVWVRPEGAWLTVSGLVQFWILADNNKNPANLFCKKNLSLIFAPAVGFILLIIVRWHLFDSLLPNTYWAKEPELIGGLKYVLEQYATPWHGLLLISALLGGLLGGPIPKSFLAAGFSWIIAAFLEGGDWMPLGRMLLGANIYFALAAGGLCDYRQGQHPAGQKSISSKSAPIALLILILIANAYGVTRETRFAHNSLVSFDRDYLEVTDWLQREEIQSAGLVDIGKVGFLSGVEIFDFAGLTDPVIAKSPGGHLDKQFGLDYLFEKKRPEVLIIRLLEPFQNGSLESSPVEVRIMRDKRFAERYSIAKKILPDYSRKPYYGLLLYRRNDSEESILR